MKQFEYNLSYIHVANAIGNVMLLCIQHLCGYWLWTINKKMIIRKIITIYRQLYFWISVTVGYTFKRSRTNTSKSVHLARPAILRSAYFQCLGHESHNFRQKVNTHYRANSLRSINKTNKRSKHVFPACNIEKSYTDGAHHHMEWRCIRSWILRWSVD